MKKVEELLKKLKDLYIKYQAMPLVGMILFMIYMIFKTFFCFTHGYCPLI